MTNHEQQLVAAARSGDQAAFAEALASYTPILLSYIQSRLDRRLRRRIDPEDVVQQALLEAVRRVSEWRANSSYPLLMWVHLIASQSLDEARRRHFGTQSRDLRREGAYRDPSRVGAVAEAWLSRQTSPSGAAYREEVRERVTLALARLEPIDREILMLRQIDGLSNEEAAQELNITPAATSKRYLRALERIKPLLKD